MPVNNFGIVCIDEKSGFRVCRSAQPDERGLLDLSIDFKFIFKLNSGKESQTFGHIVVYEPLDGWSLWYDTNNIKDICRRINEAIAIGSVLIHCVHGRERTGLVSAAYRLLYDNATLEQVMQDRKDFGVQGVIAFIDEPEVQVLHDIIAERK